MKALYYLSIVVLVTLATLAFTVLNTGVVELNLYFNVVTMPFSVLVVICICIGILLGFLVSIAAVRSRSRELRQLQKQFNQLQAQAGLSHSSKQPIQEP